MNILLSGGWGYGNIGDDAILMASLSLLRQQYPKAKVTITSYNPEYTCNVVGKEYKVLPSVHRLIFGKRAFKFLRVSGYVWNTEKLPYLWQRIYGYVKRKIKSTGTQEVLENYFAKYGWEELQQSFLDIDMFIMSGGGYFNGWEDSMMSRIIELELAKRNGVKSYICGQTIGPFDVDEEQKKILVCALKTASGICVRDVASLQDLDNWGIGAQLAPDLALSQNPMLGEEKEQRIAIVPAELPRQSRKAFIKGMADIVLKKDLQASVIVTRLYIADVECAKQICNGLRKLCGKKRISLIIPKVYTDIEQELMCSSYVVSRNLHGLILAWRSGAKCLCLNDERKFITFMRQIGCLGNMLNIQGITPLKLYEKFEDICAQENSYNRQELLCREVRSMFYKTITQA